MLPMEHNAILPDFGPRDHPLILHPQHVRTLDVTSVA
jgi:hypothetical protein